jgi:hypothetical protein
MARRPVRRVKSPDGCNCVVVDLHRFDGGFARSAVSRMVWSRRLVLDCSVPYRRRGSAGTTEHEQDDRPLDGCEGTGARQQSVSGCGGHWWRVHPSAHRVDHGELGLATVVYRMWPAWFARRSSLASSIGRGTRAARIRECGGTGHHCGRPERSGAASTVPMAPHSAKRQRACVDDCQLYARLSHVHFLYVFFGIW